MSLAEALKRHKTRSSRSRSMDARKTSSKVVQPTDKKGVERWLKNAGRRSDIRGIDTAGMGKAPAKAKAPARAKTATTGRRSPVTGSPVTKASFLAQLKRQRQTLKAELAGLMGNSERWAGTRRAGLRRDIQNHNREIARLSVSGSRLVIPS